MGYASSLQVGGPPSLLPNPAPHNIPPKRKLSDGCRSFLTKDPFLSPILSLPAPPPPCQRTMSLATGSCLPLTGLIMVDTDRPPVLRPMRSVSSMKLSLSVPIWVRLRDRGEGESEAAGQEGGMGELVGANLGEAAGMEERDERGGGGE